MAESYRRPKTGPLLSIHLILTGCKLKWKISILAPATPQLASVARIRRLFPIPFLYTLISMERGREGEKELDGQLEGEE